MRATCLIPARGGSSGVPGKNLRKCGGRSLLARAIETAMAGGCEEVCVSTDDANIACDAIYHGAVVIHRPAALATAEATTWDVVRHAITDSLRGPICLIQCTNPFLSQRDVERTMAAAEGVDLAVCVQETHDWLLDAACRPVNWSIDQTLRQGRRQQYRLVGSVWAFDSDYALAHACYSGRLALIEAEHPVQIDIDTAADLRAADACLEAFGS